MQRQSHSISPAELFARLGTASAPKIIDVRRPDLRLTVDTPADLEFMTSILGRCGATSSCINLTGIIHVADRLLARKEVA